MRHDRRYLEGDSQVVSASPNVYYSAGRAHYEGVPGLGVVTAGKTIFDALRDLKVSDAAFVDALYRPGLRDQTNGNGELIKRWGNDLRILIKKRGDTHGNPVVLSVNLKPLARVKGYERLGVTTNEH